MDAALPPISRDQQPTTGFALADPRFERFMARFDESPDAAFLDPGHGIPPLDATSSLPTAGIDDGPAEQFDLPELLACELRRVAPRCVSRGVATLFDYQGEIESLGGDPRPVRQIVATLLDNASRLTRAGQVSVRAHCEPVGHGRADLTVAVADTGPGMDPAQLDGLFRCESDVDRWAARKGDCSRSLLTAKAMARAMGGDLLVESVRGHGSYFVLQLPLHGVRLGQARQAGRTARAWVIDSSDGSACELIERLQRLDCRSIPLPTIEAAVSHAAAVSPDLLPQLVVISVNEVHDPIGLHALRSALPDVRILVLIHAGWHDGETESIAVASRVWLRQAPLVPRDLQAALGIATSAPAADTPPSHARLVQGIGDALEAQGGPQSPGDGTTRPPIAMGSSWATTLL